MKAVFKFLSAGLVIAAFGLSACSNNDDDEPKNNQSVETSPKNVFSQGLPAEVDGFTFTTNEKGQVTSIKDEDSRVLATFEYGEYTRAEHLGEKYDVLMKTIDWYGTNDLYIKTNNQGFATHVFEVYDDGETATWDFEYNSDGQMTRLKRSDGGDDFKMTYTNGNLTKVVEDDEDGDHYETIFKYTNEEYKSGRPNKGNIMLYEDMYVDMDEMDLAYYAGLLGKSTKNLPLESMESDNSDKTYTYTWTLNANDLPTEMVQRLGDNEYTTIYKFSWK